MVPVSTLLLAFLAQGPAPVPLPLMPPRAVPLPLMPSPAPQPYAQPQPQPYVQPQPQPYVQPYVQAQPQPQPQPYVQPQARPASTVVTYWVDSLPGLDLGRAWQLSAAAARRWSEAADIDFVPAPDRASATVVVRPGRFAAGWAGLTDVGDPGMLRSSGQRGLELRINPRFGGGEGMLSTVLTHEFGHAIGLGHSSFENIMAPGVGPHTRFTAHDAASAVRLYGPRRRS